MAEWEGRKRSGELLITRAQIFQAKQKGTDGTNCFKLLSLLLLPGSNPVILTLSSHTKQSILYPHIKHKSQFLSTIKI